MWVVKRDRSRDRSRRSWVGDASEPVEILSKNAFGPEFPDLYDSPAVSLGRARGVSSRVRCPRASVAACASCARARPLVIP